uniref:ShKT domain-containing protein n=1 Tax=Trichuris muris TaxID=70415 RepID=A0A5S6QLA0_TRIMR
MMQSCKREFQQSDQILTFQLTICRTPCVREITQKKLIKYQWPTLVGKRSHIYFRWLKQCLAISLLQRLMQKTSFPTHRYINIQAVILCLACYSSAQRPAAGSQLLRDLVCRVCCFSADNLCLEADTWRPCSICSCCWYRKQNTMEMGPMRQLGQRLEPFGAASPPRRICACPHSNDNDRKCSFWAHIGECERIPVFMITMCPVSCGVCC